MDENTATCLRAALQHLYPGSRLELHERSESRPWSRAFVVRRQHAAPMYLKGTPRTIPEAMTTARLHAACPTFIPRVLHTDLLPTTDWCWFVTADAGECDRLEIAPGDALQAARALGTFQRTVAGDTLLAATLPSCLPHQLYQITLGTCDALLPWCDAMTHTQVQGFRTCLVQAAGFFDSLAQRLSVLPATCVHGDFWPGNIAIQPDQIRFIDWGEAMWGSGGTSIWNLLFTSQASLAPFAAKIWEAYSDGWQQPISRAYITAARTAFFITQLVVHHSESDPGDTTALRDTLTTLQQIISQLE